MRIRFKPWARPELEATEFGFDFDETFNTSIVISPLVNVFAFNCIHHLLIICITILPH
mgnify:CR=1 FL=1